MTLSTLRRSASITAFAALAVSTFACGGADPVAVPKARIVSFNADPSTVVPGQSSLLRFEVSGATTVRIDTTEGVNVLPDTASRGASGSIVTPALNTTTIFVLKAKNASGVSSSTVTVTVDDGTAPKIGNFVVSPTEIIAGNSATLSWQSENGVGARIEVQGNQVYGVPAAQVSLGSHSVSPGQTETYTYVLVANDGTLLERQVTLTVLPAVPGPQIAAFAATPNPIDPGQSTTLTWQVQDASQVRITDAAGQEIYSGSNLSGSQALMPLQPTVYTLVATGADNQTAMQMTTVTVNGPAVAQVIAFAASPGQIDLGDAATLSWQVQDATGGITIDAGGQRIHSDAMVSGTFTVSPTQTTVYTLTAINPNGNATAQTTVSLNPVPGPQVISFTANPVVGPQGATVDLAWSTQDATSVRILAGTAEVFVSTTAVVSGTFAAPTTGVTTVFTLEALDAGLPTATQTLTVYGHAAPSINALTVNPAFITGPTLVTVAWNVSSVSGLTLAQDGASVPGFVAVSTTTASVDLQGSLQVMLTGAATFEMVASSAGGSVTQQAAVSLSGPTLSEVEPNDTLAQAQPIAGSTVLTGTLAPVDDVDIFRITVGANGNVLAETSDGMGGCSTDTVVILADLQGNTIALDDNSGQGNCSRLDPTQDPLAAELPAGDYLIGVVHAQTTGTGAYVLSVEVGAPGCGNGVIEVSQSELCDFGDVINGDGCSSSCQLEVHPTVISGTGGTVQVSLPNANSIAVIQVNVNAGQSVTATAADAGSLTCNSVSTAMNFADSAFGFLGAKSDGGPTGTAGDCAAIHFPADAFATNLSTGAYYLVVFNTGAVSGLVDVTVGIESPVCGNGLVETNAGEQCDNTGGAGQVPCNMMCQVASAAVLTLPAVGPQTLSGTLTTGPSLYEINVTQPIYLRAETFSPNVAGGCADDTVLELYTSTFGFLGIDDDGGTDACSRITENQAFSRVEPGRYWLVVAEYSAGPIAAYDLVIDALAVTAMSPAIEVEPNDTQAVAQVTGLSGPGVANLQGATNPDGDDDVYSFTVPANTTLTLNARTYDTYGNPIVCTASNGACDTRLFLETAGTESSAPGGGEVAFSDDIGTTEWCSAISGVALPGGTNGATYYLRVQAYNDTGLMYYFLNIALQ